MENSYFRSPYNPIHLPQQSPKPKPSSKPKVVSIPVHFVESVAESNTRHSAAVRIQRHLRGFLVRRKVEAVRRIEVEVDEIERRIQRDLDLLLVEEKERVRTNEMLMALLLRLDSVRGVREYRRKVIRRAILLQETVDSLSSAAATAASAAATAATAAIAATAAPEETGGKPLEDAAPEDHETPGKQEEAVMEIQETPGADGDQELPEETLLNQELEINETLETTTDQETPEEISPAPDRGTPEETLENQEEAAIENTKCQEIVKEEDQEIPVKEIGVVDEKAISMEEDDECSLIDESAPKPEKTEKENSEELGLKSVMERMVAENQTLKSLVAELCERSSLQCQLMGGLAKRVAQLEKTVQTMEKRKKKKRESK